MSDNLGFAEFDIDVNAIGRGKIMVNGADISDKISGFQVISESGENPKVLVGHRTKGLKIKGEGIVYLQADVIPMSTIIRSLDPEAIEKEALSRQGWADDTSVTEHILQVIAEQCDATES